MLISLLDQTNSLRLGAGSCSRGRSSSRFRRIPRAPARTDTGAALSSELFDAVVELRRDSGKGRFVRRNSAGQSVAAGPFHANVEQRTYVASGSAEYGAFRLNAGVQRDEFPRTEIAELVSSQGGPQHRTDRQ